MGAQLRERFGWQLQEQLLAQLHGRRYANRGEIFELKLDSMPWITVFHTLPTDGFYDTTPAIVEAVLRRCLTECVQRGDIRTVTTSALATGYGRLLFKDFIDFFARIADDPMFEALSRVTLCISNSYNYDDAVTRLHGANVIASTA